jgi:DnaJ-domain-containing protein 1
MTQTHYKKLTEKASPMEMLRNIKQELGDHPVLAQACTITG